jgi:hypothetical protein
LNSIPDGNWYCSKCVSENPALEYSMVIDNDPSDIEILYETPSVSEISTSVDSKKRTQSNENTKKSRGKKSKSRTIANSNNKRIKASRSLISKLRREIHQRRQYNIKVNKCLFEEISLINIPRNNFNEYLDAYRASTSDNVSTRNLSSLRERLKYETKRKYSKMLDTQSVNNIYEKPSSYNGNSEYDLVWRQAKLAKKIQPNSSSSFSKNSFKIKENKSFSSLKRLNITLKRMTEQETNRNNNNNKYNNDDSKNNRNNNNYNSASSSNNINNPIKINNKSYINHSLKNNKHDNKHFLSNSSTIYYSHNNSSNHNNVINKQNCCSSSNKESNNDSSNSSHNQNNHSSSNVNKSFTSSIQSYPSSTNNNDKYSSNNNNLNDGTPSSSNSSISSKDFINDLTPSSSNSSISSNDFVNDLFTNEIIPESRTSSKDHNGYSSREIFKFIRPYIKKRVKSRYITREQYKKLTRDTTFYVIKRLGNNYTGEHKLNYEELKKDFLYDHSFSNKIIINFVNYNIIKFLEINKKMTNSSSKNTPKHPKPI